jgi:hypothetical protein
MGVKIKRVALVVLILAGTMFIGAGMAGQAGALQVPVPSGPILYTINDTGVSFIDSNNGRVAAFVPYPYWPKLNRHYGAVLSRDGTSLFILGADLYPDNSGKYGLLVMNTGDHTFKSVDLYQAYYKDERRPEEDMNIAISDDASRLVVVKYSMDRYVDKYSKGDFESDRVISTLCVFDRINGEYTLSYEIKLPGMTTGEVASSPDGSKAYVVYSTPMTGQTFNDDQLMIIDFATEQTTTVSVHPCVNDIAISPDGSRLYLAIGVVHAWHTACEVGTVDLNTYQTSYFTDRVCYPLEIEASPDGSALYVIGTGQVEDPWTQSPQNDVLEYFQSNMLGANIYQTIPRYSEGLKLSPDGRSAYVRSPGKVLRYDVTRTSTYDAPSLQEEQSYGSASDIAPSQSTMVYSVTFEGSYSNSPTPTPVPLRVFPVRVNVSKIKPIATARPANDSAPLPIGLAPGFTAGARYIKAINLTGSASPATGTVTPVPSTGALPTPGIIRRPLGELTVINNSSNTGTGTNNTNPTSLPSLPANSSVSPSPVPSQAGDGLPNVVISVIALIISVSFLAMRVKR